jgi:hypothetical protein
VCFRLMHENSELHLALPFEAHIEERLLQVIGDAELGQAAERNRSDMARRIADLVTALLKGELLPPTEKQLKYAVAIARELSLELPNEALQYREVMKAFLGVHAERYRKQKGYSPTAQRASS